MLLRLLFCVLALAGTPACSSDPAAPNLPEADIRVLFVGNSLTYSNDLPGVVATVAGAAGLSVATASVAAPNYALEDHWHSGIAGVIRSLQPDYVVMQQGPSSLPESRVHLVAWTDTLSRVIREAGAEPALLMVWPGLDRWSFLDDVRDSYAAAAQEVEGVFIPAGEAVRALRAQHPELDPLGPDGFHPSVLGTIVSGMVVVATLFDVEVTGLPRQLTAPPTGGVNLTLTPEAVGPLQATADSVAAAWREAAGG